MPANLLKWALSQQLRSPKNVFFSLEAHEREAQGNAVRGTESKGNET